jgi:3-oxoacyl-[acyl-carrier protein] reductase
MILQDKVALITGATGGIGAAIADAFANAGAKIIITGRDAKKLESCKLPNCEFIVADLSQPGAASALIANTVEKFGRIDILVNNAGITRDTLLMRMTDAQMDDVMNTNFRAAFELCRAAVTHMAKQRAGRVINVSSIVGYIGGAGQANYAASKAALTALTKSIAAELGGRGITANCIAPGFIETPMTDVLPDELKRKYLEQIPAGRFGQPADVANAALFLASDMAGYINGQTLHINGGMLRI